jgi:hypothetical protein
MIWLKGATAYEFQVGRLSLRVCHLDGKHWVWKPWRRVSYNIEGKAAESYNTESADDGLETLGLIAIVVFVILLVTGAALWVILS